MAHLLWTDFGVATELSLEDALAWPRIKAAIGNRGTPGQKLTRPGR